MRRDCNHSSMKRANVPYIGISKILVKLQTCLISEHNLLAKIVKVNNFPIELVINPGARTTCFSQFASSTGIHKFISDFWELSKRDQDSLDALV